MESDKNPRSADQQGADEKGSKQEKRRLWTLLICLISSATAAAAIIAVVWASRHLDPPKDTEVGVLAVVATITLLAILGQIVVTALQWQAMKVQQQIMRETLQHTKEAFDLVERPILVVTKATVEDITAGQRLHPKIRIENKGRTGAKDIRIHFDITKGFHLDYPGNTSPFPTEIPFLGAGDFTNVQSVKDTHLVLNSIECKEVIAGKEFKDQLIIYGQGEYKDLAGKSYVI